MWVEEDGEGQQLELGRGDLYVLVAVFLKKGEFSRIERRMGNTLSSLNSGDDMPKLTGAPLRGNVDHSMDSWRPSTARPAEGA